MLRFSAGRKAHRWLSTPLAAVVIVASMLIPASAAAAEPTDMVLEWNANAVSAISNANTASPPGLNQPPPLAPIHLAMVHGAIYDAVQAIVDTHEPYLDGLDAPSSASQAAAVAAAAHGVLAGLTPGTLPAVRTSLDGLLATSLAKIPDGSAKTAGIEVGEAAAAAMLAERTNDGRFGTLTFTVGSAPGEWRTVPVANANVFAWVSQVDPFTLQSASQYRTAGPYALGSPEYAAEFNEVKAIGAVNSPRSEDETKIANFVSVNPFGMIHKALREIATARQLSTSEQARLFVMTSMSVADSLIGCWDSKVAHNFWRPQTAIREAASDGNPATDPDTTWTSLAGNPGYPDNPSGYNCLVAGAMWAARAYFGTNAVSFSMTSTGATPVTRDYDQFSGFIKDAINGRVLIGIHFRSADVQGAKLGKKVADHVASHYFAPVE